MVLILTIFDPEAAPRSALSSADCWLGLPTTERLQRCESLCILTKDLKALRKNVPVLEATQIIWESLCGLAALEQASEGKHAARDSTDHAC